MGYSVPEVDVSAIYDGKTHRRSLRIDYKQFGATKRWFPQKLHFKETADGKLQQEDKTEILSADFDKSPPESVFRLAAMDIPAGTPVIMNFDGKSRVWNGKEIVEVQRDQKLASRQFPDLPPSSRMNWSSPWLFASAGLSLAGGIFLYSAWRRRQANG